MADYRLEIPPHIAQIVRHFPPDLKRDIKQAFRALSADPIAGRPLIGELSGLWRIRVRRFRIVYEPVRRTRNIRLFAIGHRTRVYEDIAVQLRSRIARK
jgi:mRNA-degrading endonuclease RelE of RelBE toxin-antitoxin system